MVQRLLYSRVGEATVKTLIDPFELLVRSSEPMRKEQKSTLDLEICWEDTTTESHPGVSIESWHRARGWVTED